MRQGAGRWDWLWGWQRFSPVLAHASALTRRLSVKVAAAIAGIAALVLLTAGGFSLWLFLGAQMRAATELQQLQAARAAEHIERFMAGLDSRLAELIARPWSSQSEDDHRIDALRTLRALPPVTTLRLIDPDSREHLRVARLGPDVAGSGADFNANTDYGAAAETGRRVGAVYFQDGSEPYATLYLRGRSPRQGGVVADINLKLIWDVVAGTRIGAAGRMLLVDDRGHLISHPDISQVLRRANVLGLPQVQAALQAREPGGGESLVAGHDLDGKPVLSAHAHLPSLGWTVITELPRDEVLAPISAMVRLSGTALAVGLVAAVVCGIIIARSIVGPIAVLTSGAARIGSGSLDHRIEIDGSDEFKQLGARFNDMAGHLQAERATLEEKVAQRTIELARANQAKSRFLASASHDLRQPLHALSLFVAEMQAHPSQERRLRLAKKLSDAVASLNGMFDAILDVSKIEASAITVSRSTVPLGPLLDELRAMFGPVAAAKALALEIDNSTAWVDSDRVLLSRILQNLLANAVRYTDEGRVVLSCLEGEGFLTIAVSDTGPGISPEIQSEVFGEFFRAATPGQSGERGLGLGLFIVANFARLLDVPVNLHSVPGQGTTFSVRVPVAPAPRPTIVPETLQRPMLIGRGRRAAVIGSDLAARDATATLLCSWGFGTEQAGSPGELSRTDVDLVVLDCEDHSADGVLEAIAGMDGTRPDRRIVVMTNEPDSLLVERAATCLEVLRKPVPPVVFRAAVAKALGRARTS